MGPRAALLGVTLFALGGAAALGCGPARPADRTVVEVGPATPAARTLITTRILADEQRAAGVLRAALAGADRRLAAEAALHLRRLGIEHDTDRSRALLVATAADDDPLRAALACRFLIGDPAARKLREPATDDPLVDLFCGLARAAHAPRADRVPASLAVDPTVAADARDRSPGELADRLAELTVLASPYDARALALGLLFLEARAGRWVETTADGRRAPVALRLRAELFALVGLESPPAERAGDVGPCWPSPVGELLALPLATQPVARLRRMVLEGADSLRVDALRALVMTVAAPGAEDFGAAAAALDAAGAAVRVEAARTFLVFSLRAR